MEFNLIDKWPPTEGTLQSAEEGTPFVAIKVTKKRQIRGCTSAPGTQVGVPKDPLSVFKEHSDIGVLLEPSGLLTGEDGEG